MASDASIYGLIKPYDPGPGPLELYGKAAQVRNLMGQGQLQDLQTQKLSRDIDEENQVRELFRKYPDGKVPIGELFAASPTHAQAFQKTALEIQEKGANITHKNLESQGLQVKAIRDIAAQVNSDADMPAAREAAARIVGPDKVAQLPFFNSPFTPENKLRAITTADEHFKQLEADKGRANSRLIAGIDASGKPLSQGTSEPIDLAKVTPADLEAGYRYFSDGTLPPNMGRGMQGQAQSTRIRSIAAQISQNLGISPEEARANQLAFKGSASALLPLMKREAGVGANVRNFDFNAGQVLELSQRVDRTGTPVINAWLNAGRRSVSGNPELSAFDVAVKTTVNEFAQIVSGTTAGATTEGEKQKAEKLLSAAQTPAQITAVINQMRIESQNRMKSFADQKKATLAGMRAGGPAAATPTAQVAAPKGISPSSLSNDELLRELSK